MACASEPACQQKGRGDRVLGVLPTPCRRSTPPTASCTLLCSPDCPLTMTPPPASGTTCKSTRPGSRGWARACRSTAPSSTWGPLTTAARCMLFRQSRQQRRASWSKRTLCTQRESASLMCCRGWSRPRGDVTATTGHRWWLQGAQHSWSLPQPAARETAGCMIMILQGGQTGAKRGVSVSLCSV